MVAPMEEKVMMVLSRGYTGKIHQYEFKDGKSLEPVPLRLALRIAASMGAKTVDGEDLNPTIYKRRFNPSRVSVDTTSLTDVRKAQAEAAEKAALEAEDDAMGFLESGEKVPLKTWTKAELEAIADSKGIDGLRDVGEGLGVKHRSINGLMEGILKEQEKRSGKAS